MKNRVLRLMVIAVLVVALVMSMAACGEKPTPSVEPTVAPTAKPTPAPTVAPTPTAEPTPAPTTVPVDSDEAELEAKYGITFPVPEDAGYTADGVKNAKEEAVTFAPKFDANNSLYNAMLVANEGATAFEIKAKVAAEDTTGKKMSGASDYELAGDNYTLTPKKAGTYTVTYTVKVRGGEVTYGMYTTPEVNEEFEVVKTYEVAKKAVKVSAPTISVDQVTSIQFPTVTVTADDAVLTELSLAGSDADYTIYVDVLSVDMKTAGSYELPLVVKDSKDNVVETSVLSAKNYDVTFENGTCYVLNKKSQQAAQNAVEDVYAAIGYTQNGTVDADLGSAEDIELGTAAYNALSDGEKVELQKLTAANENAVNAVKIKDALDAANFDLERAAVATKAVDLAGAYVKNINYSPAKTAFVDYMINLSTDETKGKDEASDFAFAKTKVIAKYGDVSNFKSGDDIAVIIAYKNSLETAYTTAKGAFDAAYGVLTDNDGTSDYTVAQLTTVNKKLDEAKAAYADLLDEHKTTLVKDAYNAMLANVAAVSARMDAFYSIIDGRDAFIADRTDNIKTIVENSLGYTFAKAPNGTIRVADLKDTEAASTQVKVAASVIFGFDGDDDLAPAPVEFLDEIATAYNKAVDIYQDLDDAIVTRQAQLMGDLGSQLTIAVDADKKVDSFNGTAFVVGEKSVTKLKAMQNYVATSVTFAFNEDALTKVMSGKDTQEEAFDDAFDQTNDNIKDMIKEGIPNFEYTVADGTGSTATAIKLTFTGLDDGSSFVLTYANGVDSTATANGTVTTNASTVTTVGAVAGNYTVTYKGLAIKLDIAVA